MCPFVLIASFPRTGSTVLAEALTSPARSLIHIEPGICMGQLRDGHLEPHADEPAVAAAIAEIRRIRDEAPDARSYARLYMRRVVPILAERFQQVGIKEIELRRFRHRAILDERPDTRIIVTVREPRDAWLSLVEMRQRFQGDPTSSWRDVDPQEAARRFNRILSQVAELVERRALVVRYEELCTDPKILSRVFDHVDSPLARAGALGKTLERRRGWELERHGTSLSPASVGRWTQAEPELQLKAEHFAELVAEYRELFGYT